jgi:AcrR family transcriptional regulator
MKERIIETSGRLFMRYGVKSITMDDIAKELGISKKTIYQHFSDKDEIVFQVAVHQLEEDKCEYQTMNDSSKNVVEKMVKTIEMLKSRFAKSIQRCFTTSRNITLVHGIYSWSTNRILF